MSREDIFNYSSPTMDIYRSLEIEIFRKIVKRLKRTGKVDINEWQVQSLKEFGMLNMEVIKLLSEHSGLATTTIKKAIENVGEVAISDVNGALSPYLGSKESNLDMNNILKAYQDQTFININNYVNQTLISTNMGHGMLSRMYTDIINKTTLNYIAGNLSFGEALSRTIIEWTDRGIPCTFVDKGGNLWSLERYIDIVLRSTFNRTYNQLRTSRMEEFDVYTVLMGVVPDAAERCAYCQGKVLDMRPPGKATSGYPSIYLYGYGEPGGTQGISCRHPIWSFIPGVSENNQPQINPEEAILKSKYRNRQRELERRIRASKKRIMVLESFDSERVPREKELLRQRQADMRELLKEGTWLRRQYTNEKVYTPLNLLKKEYYLRPQGHFGEEAYHEFWGNPQRDLINE